MLFSYFLSCYVDTWKDSTRTMEESTSLGYFCSSVTPMPPAAGGEQFQEKTICDPEAWPGACSETTIFGPCWYPRLSTWVNFHRPKSHVTDSKKALELLVYTVKSLRTYFKNIFPITFFHLRDHWTILLTLWQKLKNESNTKHGKAQSKLLKVWQIISGRKWGPKTEIVRCP